MEQASLASDKLFVASNLSYAVVTKHALLCALWNVMGSRGSVIPFFMSVKEQGIIPITDERMTRFMISLDQGLD